jgi:surfeit locus 1 family protein
MTARSRAVSAGLAGLLGVALLCGLGAWQVQRLAWKEALIAEIAGRERAAPVPYAGIDPATVADFTKVTVDGRYLPQNSKFLITTFDGGPGWQVVTPLAIDSGGVLLVDRGAIASADRGRIESEAMGASRTLIGILRRHGEPRGPFAPDNDVAGNSWYWWDVPALQAAMKLPDGARPSPVVLQLLPGDGAAPFPAPQPPAANLLNNHLQYAVTWFSLALVLAAVTGLFIRGQMKKTTA